MSTLPDIGLVYGHAYALGPKLSTAAGQMYAAGRQCFVLACVATVSKERAQTARKKEDRE